MPHPITDLLVTYNINRHDIRDASWPGFKRLCEAAGAMFKHNFILYRQQNLNLGFLIDLRDLLAEWEQGEDLDPNRMIDQLRDKLDAHSDIPPKRLVEAAENQECTCPPGYVCPVCTADGSWRERDKSLVKLLTAKEGDDADQDGS